VKECELRLKRKSVVWCGVVVVRRKRKRKRRRKRERKREAKSRGEKV